MSEENKKGIRPPTTDLDTVLIPPPSSAASISLSSFSSSSSSSSPSSSFFHNQSFSSIQLRIHKVEKDIEETKKRRDKHKEGSPVWFEYNTEVKQLRDELKQLRTKEEQLNEERKSNQLTGKKKKKYTVQQIIMGNHVFMSG
jgi:Skp family chaperone for outer membrane proteins